MTTKTDAPYSADQRLVPIRTHLPWRDVKSFRLIEIAQQGFETEFKIKVDILDLSRLASEYGRNIHPCKACFSTAAPLCHWPCSCYPNHAMGQTQDWMNDIYPR